MAVIAGIVFLVARDLIDCKEIGTIFRGPRHKHAVLLVTFVAKLAVQLEYTVFIGISLLLRRSG